jgi:hypothetical protein
MSIDCGRRSAARIAVEAGTAVRFIEQVDKVYHLAVGTVEPDAGG